MAVSNPAPSCTVAEYLTMSYQPDCDYVDDHLEQRNSGEYDHATIQTLLAIWFGNHKKEWGIRIVVEIRVQVSESRFRVPDVCVLKKEGPVEQIIRRPPLICMEVLSPEDTIQRALVRFEDYRRMGVVHIWLLDPSTRKGYVYTPSGLNQPENETFTVSGTDIFVPLAQIFAELDEA